MIDNNTLIIVASILGAAIIGVGASLGATKGDSTVASKALECMARQPEQAGSFQVNMLIAIGWWNPSPSSPPLSPLCWCLPTPL